MTQAKSASSPKPEKIHALTSLRFFAALYVVLFHTLANPFPSVWQIPVIGHVLQYGYLSVSFFFLLSGYILAMVYLQPGKPVDKKSFWTARFARVYPLFLITLIADTPNLLVNRIHEYGIASAIAKTSVTFLGNMAMLQAWILTLKGINNPNWSLSVETFFYFVFPFIAIVLWKLRGLQIWLAALSLWIVGQVAVYFASLWMNPLGIQLNPLLHTATFALGILLARWQTLQSDKHGASPRHNAAIVAALFFALVGFTAAISTLSVYWRPFLNDGLMAPVFVCIIWAFSANQSLPAKILSMKWLVVLGEASFGLYLIHVPVDHLFHFLGLQTSIPAYPAYLATCIGLSVLSFYYVETPSRRWILRKMRSRTRETMEAASDTQ